MHSPTCTQLSDLKSLFYTYTKILRTTKATESAFLRVIKKLRKVTCYIINVSEPGVKGSFVDSMKASVPEEGVAVDMIMIFC